MRRSAEGNPETERHLTSLPAFDGKANTPDPIIFLTLYSKTEKEAW
jgi:hypothetical protein